MRAISLQSFALTTGFLIFGCATTETPGTGDTGGTASAEGGSVGTGGTTSSGGSSTTGGTTSSGGSSTGTGGVAPSGGQATGGSIALTGGSPPGTGGNRATGGMATGGAPTGGASTGGTRTGGAPSTGGTASGGMAASGGAATGGTATGGKASGGTATGGTATGGTATGGKATGGSATGGSGGSVNCSATMPTGGTDHCGANTQGTAGGLAWSLWSNAINSNSCITTFNTTAFSARWNNSGDFLARVGVEWGNSGKSYTQYNSITAQFSYTKTGTGGGYSYIGIYGWTNNPCVEYYIVDDSYNTFPFNAYNATLKGTVSIDGENYKLFQNSTTGSGGSRCSGVTTWNQFWSIRQKARQCGTISIKQHFEAWTAAGMTMGSNLLEAKILVEVGGGVGSVSFPVANVTAQ